MDFTTILQDPITRNLFAAAVLGSLLGLEREIARKDPSLRTFMLICLGSCTFSILSLHTATDFEPYKGEPSRIAAQIVVGIGFLGAGTIYRSRDRVLGLTTAALMWLTAAIGACVGFGKLSVAFSATIIALAFMVGLSLVHRIIAVFWDTPKKLRHAGHVTGHTTVQERRAEEEEI